ncbi:hypothetical protein A3F28_00415 [Candidatus Uhrbacteria bacterium RIFCSPHIGHO2_12_FULL_57_11]|uniref:YprB ribonuclease H-like domain-containing protein n=2 Tax=Candidatus Uhriibacteriota TaxID=1752732 RepID=A0A1F7UGU6_9BACT|nr:MAG: hypothetical protein A3D72_03115 [Candidatus Uhrbacteria bacterium RIFCSPHIGHO2_02_FULL_57_19]OGL77506.1 MAG: hypothetical protein A3F28_00415 [Candidatus Uhrbacteria bacterium RIFCSPHIGHO2_12_FULL_57_11]
MREIVLDIETQNTFQEIGSADPRRLKVSLVGIHHSDDGGLEAFREGDLPRLWPVFERADRLIGYNIKGFDLPVLNAYYPGDLLRFPTLDIMEEIAKVTGFRVKLDDVARSTLGEGKTGSGLQAIEFFRKGEWDKLEAYCLSDVRLTRQIYEFGLREGFVRIHDRQGKDLEIPVAFALPAVAVRPTINLTMPF